jgi:hypothetical protein
VGDTNGVSDVFVRDTCINSSGSSGAAPDCEPSTLRVSLAADRAEANGPSSSVSISATGRFITFRSEATNLDPASSPSTSDMFLTDTCAPRGIARPPHNASISASKNLYRFEQRLIRKQEEPVR